MTDLEESEAGVGTTCIEPWFISLVENEETKTAEDK
jgi:hypothetical protein